MPALAVALLLVTTVTVVSFGMADRAYLSSECDIDQRRVAGRSRNDWSDPRRP